MPYKFSFDLSGIPKSFFIELTRIASQNMLRRRLNSETRRLARNLTEITGLKELETRQLVEDLVDVYAQNFSERKRFEGTKVRALLLPHCSRKYMDGRCKASFDPDIPSYICGHCSEDCLVNRATTMGSKNGYIVYVLAGGSCIPNILKREKYDGIVGVACGQEVQLGGEDLRRMGFVGQAIPLIRNGCANTCFNLETLEKIL